MSGRFIVLEGVEGSGKTTQVALLGQRLSGMSVAHRLTREPGGTAVGEQIRSVLLHGGPVPAEAELLLMLAARAAHVHEVVRPALAAGEIVVCDRYELSTFAYQGIGRDLGLERVKQLNDFATSGVRPDLTIVVDVGPELGAARRTLSRPEKDRIERESAGFHARVAEAYRLLAAKEPGVMLVDGTPPANVVHREIMRVLALRFPETFAYYEG